ncbi:tungstate transport system substrate-binding protein [Cognatiyoonia koreensis]|uniref:Tungstate transport system substrate-binding protein n=1 Tax=Cognatiyoonia koreensis TaxID=364200 RepID=A0A1I0PFG9_9RHOB|nr:substrate-binding domain-containing protein [Cognatiyoonia koreensis]SEW13046.1 tungstate transport system substrate-binding protein [Cognatiyoonia koreensis]
MIRLFLVAMLLAAPAMAEPLILQSTTSTQNSGLYDAILPPFSKETGIDVHVVAVGTGQALKNAQNCDGDLLLVHAKDAELAFIAAGYGTRRDALMYNDFVVVGPTQDAAAIGGIASILKALQVLDLRKLTFVSRGDDSGTHQAEMALWNLAGLDPARNSGSWYLETGSGMGATLNTAVGLGAYTITDRATWVRYANKQGFDILVAGDPLLFNQYGIVTLNPSHCPNANHTDAAILRDWLLGETGQAAISEFRIGGEQVFFPNATP